MPLPASTSPIRVRYAETDKMGVVYYANYFVWFEIGRTDWLRQMGLTYRAMEDDGLRLPVIDARCEYLAGARYDDEIDVRTAARGLSAVRIAFDYDVVRRADGQALARGYTIHAAIGPQGRPVRLPAKVRELLA